VEGLVLSAPRRLSHVLTRADLVELLASTYATASGVDEELARERLQQAFSSADSLLEDLYDAIGETLSAERGPRQTEDEQLDRMGKNIPKRLRRPRPAAESPALSALLVQIDLAAGLAPERMRAMLESDKGRALLAQGLRQLATHLVAELLRS
jgi:hypothetical protein